MGDPGTQCSGQWWQRPFAMLQTNLREIDADMDVDDVADFIRDYGADAWLIGVGGIQAQYPTTLSFQTFNPLVKERKSGDLISDALVAAQSRGLRLLARMDFSKVSAEVATEHPEWLYRSSAGELQKHTGGLVSVCPSAGYYQERIFDILDEVIQRHPLDGFFVNWTSMNEIDYYKRYHGVCHCSRCQLRWAQLSTGVELPRGPEDASYSQWVKFSREIINGITGRIRAFIAERSPDACLILGEAADVMFHEANNAVDRQLWHHATSEYVSCCMAYRPDVAVLVNSTTFLDMPYRMASENPTHFAQYILQTISRGGRPSTYMMGIPGRIPYSCFELGRGITRFYTKWKSVYDGLQPCARTALVWPDHARVTSVSFDEALSEYRGLYCAMQELHVPFDVVGQQHLEGTADNGGLERYQVIVLPNLGKLGGREVEILDEWVAQGGCLIATASSGIGDDGMQELKSLPVHRQLAVDCDRERLWSSYYALLQTKEHAHAFSGPIIPIYGTSYQFEWKTPSEAGYKTLAYAPFSPPEKAYGNVQVEQRGFGSSRFGNGKGIVIPFTVGRGYHELGLDVFRDFYAEIFRTQSNGSEELVFQIAEQVEITVNSNGPLTIVHLINMSGARKRNFGTHVPILGGTINVKAGRKVKAHALRSDIQLKTTNGKILLPTLELFEVVVIEECLS